MTQISSHTGFQPLKEVWLGDCYPVEYYEHFESHERDLFQQITEVTQSDLGKIQLKLEQLGVVVRRPEFKSIDLFLDDEDNLIKPPITPRDWAMTLADTLYIVPQCPNMHHGFESTVKEYLQQNQKVQVLDRSKHDDMCYLSFPSTVRVGRDLFVDCAYNNPGASHLFHKAASRFVNDYRVHVTYTGDHNDGIFCPIKAGHIFTTHYRELYDDTFPGWEVFFLPNTTLGRNWQPGNWWLPGKQYSLYSDTITKKAQSWVGDSRETVFEVNMLVVDEKNILCIAEDDAACRRLAELGISAHVVEFSTRGFWDGGLHCLTVDISREGAKEDYWPGRGDNGAYYE